VVAYHKLSIGEKMTHATILVRYEGKIEDVETKIATLLDPYDENKEVTPYKVYLSDDDVKRMAEHYKVDMKTENAMELLLPHMKEWDGNHGGKDEKGVFHWSQYNPQSKWDWYQIGGRWQGKLVLKKGSVGKYFKKPHQDNCFLPIAKRIEVEKGESFANIDAAYLKDIDFEFMLERARTTAEKDWVESQIADPVEKYFVHGVEKDETKEQFLVRRVVPLRTHAVLVEGKEWEEPSEMGWFGTTHDEKEKECDWANKFTERYLANPTEQTVIVVVDYHI
jgi:hypothetical protein